MTQKPLPRKCLTACEVPHLCAMACPLNNHLEQINVTPELDTPIEQDEPIVVIIDTKNKRETCDA